jgi:hypothetical protein
MWAGRVGAHDGPMFTSYDMTRAFVAERQETLRHEARQHHQGRAGRRGRRGVATRHATPIHDPIELPVRRASDHGGRQAA